MNSQDHSRDTDMVDPALQKLAEEHPYYAIAQFDLLRSFESNRSLAFHHQAAKTALFFTNTNWLSWQLHPKKLSPEEIKTLALPGDEETKENDVVESDFLEENKEETLLSSHSMGDDLVNAPTDFSPPQLPITDAEPFADYKSTQSIEQQEILETKLIQQPEVREPEVIKEEIMNQGIEEEEIAFEPLHTVDYFASQGIKVTEEPVSNDKLGKQLKSFTEWLKSMKKVHAVKGALPDEMVDRKIQSIADESNANADVVTEAMAEVLVKQGRQEKASEMYRKLSLINPSKSAYFAAKIESLKEI